MADVGDVPFRGRFKLEESLEDIEHFAAFTRDNPANNLGGGGEPESTRDETSCPKASGAIQCKIAARLRARASLPVAPGKYRVFG